MAVRTSCRASGLTSYRANSWISPGLPWMWDMPTPFSGPLRCGGFLEDIVREKEEEDAQEEDRKQPPAAHVPRRPPVEDGVVGIVGVDVADRARSGRQPSGNPLLSSVAGCGRRRREAVPAGAVAASAEIVLIRHG